MPEETYLAALGRAVYSIAYTEWLVVEVAQSLDTSLTLDWLAGRTSGTIAAKFRAAVELSSLAADGALRAALESIADDWLEIIGPRNDVVHARPATAEDGAQRLFRWAPGVGAEARFITVDVLADLSARALEIGARLAPLRGQLGPAS
jgi:hypothetical protein